jgi:hypothetical protein
VQGDKRLSCRRCCPKRNRFCIISSARLTAFAAAAAFGKDQETQYLRHGGTTALHAAAISDSPSILESCLALNAVEINVSIMFDCFTSDTLRNVLFLFIVFSYNVFYLVLIMFFLVCSSFSLHSMAACISFRFSPS